MCSDTANLPILELIPQAQSYDWGKLGEQGSKVAEYSKHLPGFEFDPKKPYAELWMGTHPSLPTKIKIPNDNVHQPLLKDHLSLNPSKFLGDRIIQKFNKNNELPFLLKVLAIRKALSIQAHPDLTLAKKLFIEQPNVYKDPNHKPEMAIALTDFKAFCGFRPLIEIDRFLKTVPEFSNLLDQKIKQDFMNSISSQQIDQQNQSHTLISCNINEPDDDQIIKKNKQLLKDLFESLMNCKQEQIEEQLKRLIQRITLKKQQRNDDNHEDSIQSKEEEELRQIEDLILILNKEYPNDIGIFCCFVLNLISLKEGESLFLKANEPHAYLSGDIIECMASSDNVIRAGLTNKPKDIKTLIEMLTYNYNPIEKQKLKPKPYKQTKYTLLYDPPIEEFSISLTKLIEENQEEFIKVSSSSFDDDDAKNQKEEEEGPSILIFTSGIGYIIVGGLKIHVDHIGQSFFIAAGLDILLVSKSSCSPFTCFRAFI